MSRKEVMDMLLSKIPADKKDAFVKELRAAKDRGERVEVVKKYGVKLSDEEAAFIRNDMTNAIPDEELDKASGGCCNKSCSCNTGCSCN